MKPVSDHSDHPVIPGSDPLEDVLGGPVAQVHDLTGDTRDRLPNRRQLGIEVEMVVSRTRDRVTSRGDPQVADLHGGADSRGLTLCLLLDTDFKGDGRGGRVCGSLCPGRLGIRTRAASRKRHQADDDDDRCC